MKADSGVRLVLQRRKAPYSARAGDSIPVQVDGKTLSARVEQNLESQQQPVVITQDTGSGRVFISPA